MIFDQHGGSIQMSAMNWGRFISVDFFVFFISSFLVVFLCISFDFWYLTSMGGIQMSALKGDFLLWISLYFFWLSIFDFFVFYIWFLCISFEIFWYLTSMGGYSDVCFELWFLALDFFVFLWIQLYFFFPCCISFDFLIFDHHGGVFRCLLWRVISVVKEGPVTTSPTIKAKSKYLQRNVFYEKFFSQIFLSQLILQWSQIKILFTSHYQSYNKS